MSILRNIDESVEALDRDILLGKREGREERTFEGGERTDGEEEEGDTMDMSG
jgi:hypothetical protein